MPSNSARYQSGHDIRTAEGWQAQRLTAPSRLFGANGLRAGPDGRVYVAQVSGSQISAINVDTGSVEAIAPKGGNIVAPDDIVFDEHGNIFATEITEGRVSMRAPDGSTRVVYGDMPCANPITIYQGRLLAGECRPGGRIMELDLYGGAPRIILENAPLPNAMEVGPDGMLYIPMMGANEIWRVSLDGGAPETVATGLGVPDSVKFDRNGQIISTQVASGQVLRIDPRTGAQTTLASIAPGLDNLTFVGDRLFVSSISGQVNEVLANGETRSVVPDGLNWPLDLSMGSDGTLFVADGPFSYFVQPDGSRQVAGMLFTPGCPGHIRGGLVVEPGELIVTNANGQVSRWWPARMESEVLAEGFQRLYGVALTKDGAVIVADAGTGSVSLIKDGNTETLAIGLNEPIGVLVLPNGDCLVSESKAGKISRIVRGSTETVVDDLQEPHGMVLIGSTLYIADVLAKELVAYDLETSKQSVIVSGLPLGAPQGIQPKFLKAIPPLSGPMGPFTGVTAGADGTIYVSGDAEGSIIAVRPN